MDFDLNLTLHNKTPLMGLKIADSDRLLFFILNF